MRRCALCDHEKSAHVEDEGCLWTWRTGESGARESHTCTCPGFVERDRPALQLSLGEDPLATLGRQIEETQNEIRELLKQIAELERGE